jgi:hypothetical protein
MERGVRYGAGIAVLLSALGVLFYGVTSLRTRDYLACIILVLTGLSLMRASIELLRATTNG